MRLAKGLASTTYTADYSFMKMFGLTVVAAALVLACSENNAPPSAATAAATLVTEPDSVLTPTTIASPRSRPDPFADLAPLATITGVANVDIFLEHFRAGDFDAMAADAIFEAYPCTQDAQSLSTALCLDDEQEGASVSRIMVATCEAELKPSSDFVKERLELMANAKPLLIDSVWGPGFRNSANAVVLVWATASPVAFIVYVDENGNYYGSSVCSDYRLPLGQPEKLWPSP
jgi:hypothetical protein